MKITSEQMKWVLLIALVTICRFLEGLVRIPLNNSDRLAGHALSPGPKGLLGYPSSPALRRSSLEVR